MGDPSGLFQSRLTQSCQGLFEQARTEAAVAILHRDAWPRSRWTSASGLCETIAAPMIRRPCLNARHVVVGEVKARSNQGSIASITSCVAGLVWSRINVRSISAASIVAKVYRDRLCLQLHEEHPQYGFDSHKGYSTPEHLSALREHGACPHHRRSFAPVRERPGPAVLSRVAKVTQITSRATPCSSGCSKLARRRRRVPTSRPVLLEGEHLCQPGLRAAAHRFCRRSSARAHGTSRAYAAGRGGRGDGRGRRCGDARPARLARHAGTDRLSSCRRRRRRRSAATRRASSSTGSRTPAMSAASCAAPRPSASAR